MKFEFQIKIELLFSVSMPMNICDIFMLKIIHCLSDIQNQQGALHFIWDT